MSEALDRYLKAKAAERETTKIAEDTISRFCSAAGKLRDWKNVGFAENRSPARIGMSGASPEKTIVISDVPTIADIQTAINKAKEAIATTQNSKMNVPEQERQELKDS